MKLIDEQGKIFGKYNLFDVTVVLAVIVFLGIGVQSYKLFHTPQNPIYWKIQDQIVVVCHFPYISERQLKEIKVGDQTLGPAKRVIAEIIELFEASPSNINATLSDHILIPAEVATPHYQMEAKIRLFGQIKNDGYMYWKDRPIQLDTPIDINVNSKEVRGYIRSGFSKKIRVKFKGSIDS